MRLFRDLKSAPSSSPNLVVFHTCCGGSLSSKYLSVSVMNRQQNRCLLIHFFNLCINVVYWKFTILNNFYNIFLIIHNILMQWYLTAFFINMVTTWAGIIISVDVSFTTLMVFGYDAFHALGWILSATWI